MVSAVICGYCFVESDTTAIWHMLIFSNFGGTEFEMCHEHAAYFHSYCKCLPCCLILKQYCFKNIMLHGIQFRSEKRILARFKIPAFQAHEPQQWCLSRTQNNGLVYSSKCLDRMASWLAKNFTGQSCWLVMSWWPLTQEYAPTGICLNG